jgi:succinate dehydrogenase / fumarate reductase membrane anchor subunit
LVQRVTAVILLTFFGYLGVRLLGRPGYEEWVAMFAPTWMKIYTLLAALSIAAHAWIGMWGVFTDYLTERLLGAKGNVLRISLQLLTSLALVVYVIWAIEIIWV